MNLERTVLAYVSLLEQYAFRSVKSVRHTKGGIRADMGTCRRGKERVGKVTKIYYINIQNCQPVKIILKNCSMNSLKGSNFSSTEAMTREAQVDFF